METMIQPRSHLRGGTPRILVLSLGLFTPLLLPVVYGQRAGTVNTVEHVDLDRYAGLWHEVARIPNRFQRKCAGETTAFYSLREDGRIDVLNSCTDKNGKTIEASGIARVVDQRSNSKLKVSFVNFLGRWWFWGDYWIIGLGDNYDYAIVGTPGRKYGWILGRQTVLPQEVLADVHQELRDQGYDPGDFQDSSPTAPR